jgi:hypothetical protein
MLMFRIKNPAYLKKPSAARLHTTAEAKNIFLPAAELLFSMAVPNK